MKKHSTEMDKVAREIATYFTNRVDFKDLAEWIALSNSLLHEEEYNEGTCDLYEFIYYMGAMFMPHLIGTKTKEERFTAVKEYLPVTLLDFRDGSMKNSLAQLGKLYLNDFEAKTSLPVQIEKFMGMLTTFMVVAEMMDDYDAYYRCHGQVAA